LYWIKRKQQLFLFFIPGTFNFFGLNFYSASMVTAADPDKSVDEGFFTDSNVISWSDPSWLG